MNYVQKFYNTGAGKIVPNKKVDAFAKSIATGGASDKQYALYKDMREYLTAKGVDVSWVKRPKNRREMTSRINTLYTLMMKNNLYEEFRKENDHDEG